MGEQQSQKQGVKSSAQKEDRARNGYDELPASRQDAGAFGERERNAPTDRDLSLTMADKNRRKSGSKGGNESQ
jgi:hypothetical protein